jgi:hypothetical protein
MLKGGGHAPDVAALGGRIEAQSWSSMTDVLPASAVHLKLMVSVYRTRRIGESDRFLSCSLRKFDDVSGGFGERESGEELLEVGTCELPLEGSRSLGRSPEN